MSAVWFVLKTFVLSLLLLSVLQLPWGGQNLETRLEQSIRAGASGIFFTDVARGGIAFVQDFQSLIQGRQKAAEQSPSSPPPEGERQRPTRY